LGSNIKDEGYGLTPCTLCVVTRLPAIIAALAAIFYAFWFAWGVSSAANLFGWRLPDSGGIGAVSVGIIESTSDLLIYVSAVVANRSIARWARQAGPFVRGVHLGHLAALLALPLLIVVSSGVLLGGLLPSGRSVAVVMLIITGLFVGQTGLLAVLLALFAWDRSRRPTRVL
jgi:hypothetical protein